MTGPTKQQQTDMHALALRERDQEIQAVGQLPPEAQVALAYRKRMAKMASELANTQWGVNLEQSTRRAVAVWADLYGIDVVTEIDVLGSKVYLNAKFYLRKLAEMVQNGEVEYAYADHIEPNTVLNAMAEEGDATAKAEVRRRTFARATFFGNEAESAASAVVFHVKHRNMTQEITGAKWCGGRGHTRNQKPKDPVGEEFPIETSESRAARRAMRLLTGHSQGAADVHLAEIGSDDLTIKFKGDRDKLRAQGIDPDSPPDHRGHPSMAIPGTPARLKLDAAPSVGTVTPEQYGGKAVTVPPPPSDTQGGSDYPSDDGVEFDPSDPSTNQAMDEEITQLRLDEEEERQQ